MFRRILKAHPKLVGWQMLPGVLGGWGLLLLSLFSALIFLSVVISLELSTQVERQKINMRNYNNSVWQPVETKTN